MLRLTACSLFVAALACAQAQEAFVVGSVRDRADGAAVEHAVIRIRETQRQFLSDSAGAFGFGVRAQQALRLQVQRESYFPREVSIRALNAAETLRVLITLEANPVLLGEVVVEDQFTRLHQTPQSARSAEAAMRQPGAFEDPLRSLQQTPGVNLRSDWDGQISVRGASPDQNLAVIDGFTLPNPYRLQFALGGGMSLVNIGLLRHALLWKSGFSPRFGDRTAGLIMFETKTVAQEQSELRLNLFDAGLLFARAFAQQRTSVLLAARRNYHDAFERLVALEDFAFPRWQDVQFKAAHRFSPRHHVELLAIGAKEWTELALTKVSRDRVRERAETVFAGLVQRSQLGTHTLWENCVSYFQGPSRLRYDRDAQFAVADYRLDDRAWQWRSELTHGAPERRQWLFGFDLAWQRQWADLDLEVLNADSPLVLPENFFGARRRKLLGLFVESRLVLSEALVLHPGVRFAGEDFNENLNAEPRFTLTGTHGRLNYRAHWGLYYQTLDWQSLFRREFPMDVSAWRTLPRERARLASADVSLRLGRGWQLAVGAYWRGMNPLIVPIDESEGAILEFRKRNTGALFPAELQANRPRITRGGQSGIELALSQNHSTRNLNLHYAYARSRMRDLDNTRWIPTVTDRPHDAAFELSQNLGAHLQLGTFLRYASGQPFTPVTAILRDLEHERWPSGLRFEYAPRNSRRLAEYFRLDLRVTRQCKLLGTRAAFYLEGLNLTNHKNIYQILWLEKEPRRLNSGNPDAEILLAQQEIPMLPRMLAGGMTIRF